VRLGDSACRVAPAEARFAQGRVSADARTTSLGEAAGATGLVAQDGIEYGDLAKKYQQSTFGAHFVEVAVDAATREIRVRRMLAACASGRILNPLSARSAVYDATGRGCASTRSRSTSSSTRCRRSPDPAALVGAVPQRVAPPA
jgi:CO/xanthine dehydrogenase Mo-binding subunit